MTTTTTPSSLNGPAALQSVIVAANQANAKLSSTVDTLIKQAQLLAASATAQNDLVNTIAQRQADLESLEVQFTEQRRQREVQFDLDLKADALRKVNEVLTSQGKVSIDATVLNKLRADFETLSMKFDEQVETEVAKARQQAQAASAQAINQAKLEFAATSATEKASINSLTEKNTLLQQQINDYKAQIAADRDARVAEAEARGTAMVNVTSGK